MKKIVVIFFGLILLLVIIYFLGSKPTPPKFETVKIELPESLEELEAKIIKEEKEEKGIKLDNEARIIWADSSKQKTKIAFLYLHGFSGSQADGDPMHTSIAKKFNANIYLFRNAYHGVDLGDSTMMNATSDDFIYEAEKALAIASKLGDEVIVMGTSLGGLLTLYLASKHPEIKAIALYSPGIAPRDKRAKLLAGPWGAEIAKLMFGGEYMDLQNTDSLRIQYDSKKVHINGLMAAVNLMEFTSDEENFRKIKCPTFLCYWYKNEEVQDNVVSVDAMLKMFDNLGTPQNQKRHKAIPNAGHHVIASSQFNKNYLDVEIETEKFLKEVVFN